MSSIRDCASCCMSLETTTQVPISHLTLSVTNSATLLHACVLNFYPNRHTPFIPRTRAVAIFLSAVLQTYAQPLCLPFSLLRHLSHVSLNPDLVAFFFTERVDGSNIKAPTATSKRRPTTSEDAWVVFMSHAARLS